MIRIAPAQVTLAIRSLFRTDEMQAVRCFLVLKGLIPGRKILVDNLIDPHWAFVQEAGDDCLFLGGNVDIDGSHRILAIVTRLIFQTVLENNRNDP
jgi:hypothetical protein